MSWTTGPSGRRAPRIGIAARPGRAFAAILLASGIAAGCRDAPVTGPPATGPLEGTAPAHPIGSFRLPVVNAAPATISAQFLVTPTGLEFGEVPVGVTAPAQAVTITNVATAATTVAITGGGAGEFGGATNCTGRTLNPGESCWIEYRFSPTATGPAAVTANFTLNGESFSVDLTGTGVATQIVVTPTRLEFGEVPVGTTAPSQSVTLRNVGTTTAPVSLAGGGAGAFGGVNGCPSTLAPGQSCPISYAFKPTTTGPATQTATLSVNGVPYTLDFSGTGVAPPVLVSPTRFEFGEVPVGVTASSQSVTLTNMGTATAPVSLAGGGAGVFGGVNGCPSTLAAGQSCTISYAFKPTATGPATQTATLSVNGIPYSLDFSGTGIPTGGTPAGIVVTRTRFDFGAVPVGATAPSQAVTLTNTGTTTASVGLAGGGAGVFGGASSCPSTLAPGQSCSISYAFTPTAIGPATKTVTLSAGGVTYTLDFSGTGAPPVLVSPTRLEFGEVPVGTTAPSQAVTLTNTGTTTVPVSLAGGAAGVFGGANGCSSTLAPGQSCSISYAFTPAATGPATHTATLFVNDVPYTLDFSGTGVGDEFLVTPTGLNFGNIDLGQTSPSQSVTVTNAGAAAVTVTFAGGGVGAPFNSAQNCVGAVLNPGASCQVVYSFSPTASGLATATSNFTLNGIPFSVELSGFGFGDTEGPVADPVNISPAPAEVGGAVTLTATIDDQATGGSDIASAEYSIDGGPWTPMSAVDQTFDSPVEDVAATLTAPGLPGLYNICVRGTDQPGNTGIPGCVTLAVYDPNGGFATGGGWFPSPPGAFTDDPTLSGKATFTFVAKYRHGATAPDGNTRLHFKVAGLGFEGTAYDFLIVNQGGAYAQLEGSGLINGYGAPNGTPFHFMIRAGVGHPDTLRIRIWWKDAGQELTVYDNGVGQPLGGGSIVIHQ